MGNIWDGNWLWLWVKDEVLGGDAEKIADEALKLGVAGVLVKAHDGRASAGFLEQFKELVGPLKSRGLRVAAWGYLYGNSPDEEAALAAEALRLGADFYVADAEAEFERQGMDEAAERFFSALLAKARGGVVGFTSFALGNLHPRFPWSVFARACNVAFPQAYWRTMGISAEQVLKETLEFYAPFGLPVVPVGQAYGPVTTTEMLEFAKLAREAGCPGVSWWSWQHASPEMLEAIREVSKLFTNGKDYEGRWSEEAIDKAKELGIMSGYEDGTFRPTQPLTREEAAVVAVRLWDAARKQFAEDLRELARLIAEFGEKISP